MLKSGLRVLFALAVALSLTFGVFSGMALAASSQPTATDGSGPVMSVPDGINYCYPSGYNRQGWRCGWRLAMAPYNLGSYYNNYYYGYNGYYGYGYNNPYYNYGYGGKVQYNNGTITDYGGLPRFGPYNNYYYNYNNYYPTCYYVNGYLTCY